MYSDNNNLVIDLLIGSCIANYYWHSLWLTILKLIQSRLYLLKLLSWQS